MSTDQGETLSTEEFIEKYRRLAGHIAWTFVRRSHKEISPIVLTQEDAEDFASCALLKLVKCPPQYRDQKFFVNRLIVNAIITAWRKRLKQMETEWDQCMLGSVIHKNGGNTGSHHNGGIEDTREGNSDIFDRLPGPDGLHGKTQVKFDSATAMAFLPNIPQAERLVIELNFGLGCPPCGVERIGKKLGRSKTWVELRINRGILRIREQLTSQPQILPV